MNSAQISAWVKKNPLPVGCGLGALVLAVATFLRSDAVPAATAELDRLSTEAHRYALNLNNANQLKDQYEAIAAANKEIENRMIRASQLGINQQYFYKLESEYHVKLTDVRQTATRTVPKAAFVPIGFSATVQGDYPAVLAFLQGLERGSHFCRVLSANCRHDLTIPCTLTVNLELLGQP